LCAHRATMTVKLTEKSQEVNAAKLKIIEKDDWIKWLSEQLKSKSLRSFLALLLNRSRHVCLLRLVDPFQ
jgi:DNA repair protein RadC